MKKILFALLPALLLLGSCRSELNVNPAADEKEVDIDITSPRMATRGAIDSEARIDRLDVLVFQGTGENAKFLYRRYAWPKTGSTSEYRTTLKLGEDLTLFFAANAKAIIDNAPSHIFDEENGTLWSEAMEYLIIKSPEGLSHTDGLPMWGQLTGQKIEDKTVNTLGTVKMLRSVASADFMVTEAATDDFTLEAVHIVYGADRGYLPYHDTQVSTSLGSLVATKPYAPGDMVTTAEWGYTVPTNEKNVNNHFYLFDNDAKMPSGSSPKKQTKLIMKGTWDGDDASGQSTYYPIAFRDKDENTGDMVRMQITRNFKYQIAVTKVNGDGFSSLEEARDGEEINVDYEVIPWFLIDDTELIVSGNEFVSLESKKANLFRSTFIRTEIGMSTSYTRDDIRLSLDKDNFGNTAGPFTLTLTDTELDLIEFCTVALTQNGDRFTFTFSAKKNFDNNPDTTIFRQGSFFVKIGRIEFEIMVRQHNLSEADWQNGGNIDWP